jgi:hypothetical protein
MKNNNTTSSSSTAQNASDPNLTADSPLDGAACSASYFGRYGEDVRHEIYDYFLAHEMCDNDQMLAMLYANYLCAKYPELNGRIAAITPDVIESLERFLEAHC